jgi:hypothetical protein
LAAFWPQAPALWFAQAECTFAVKRVVAQFDRYCHVVAALPHESIRLVADIVESEPSETPYDDIKQRLVASHQLSDFQKAERLFQMPALGGRKPTELMAAMLETCPRGEEKTNLFACIFLQRLPREIRVLLAKADHKDPKTLATQADELWALQDNNGGGVAAVQENPEADFVPPFPEADSRRRTRPRRKNDTQAARTGGFQGFQKGQAGRRPLHQALEVREGRLFLCAALQLAGKRGCQGQLNAVVPGELHLTDSITVQLTSALASC